MQKNDGNIREDDSNIAINKKLMNINMVNTGTQFDDSMAITESEDYDQSFTADHANEEIIIDSQISS